VDSAWARWVSSVPLSDCSRRVSREARCSSTCARRPGPSLESSARSPGDEEVAMRERYVAAIDQGTASSRCLVFDRSGRIVSVAQKEHHHVYPRPGWVEHDPEEVCATSRRLSPGPSPMPAWSPPIWLRWGSPTSVRRRSCGTGRPARPCTPPSTGRTCEPITSSARWPPASYFSGPKLRWLLDTVPGLSDRGQAGEVLFGTKDSWLIWRLTGAASDRRDQRQPQAVDEPAHARLR
jgi:hypothetical protein